MTSSTTKLTFNDLLQIGRNQILDGYNTYNNIKNKSSTSPKKAYNFTGYDTHFFEDMNMPFFNHVYLLNYFVFSVHSSVYCWTPSKLNGICIAFYMPAELIEKLEVFCKENNYLLTKFDGDSKKYQLKLTNSRVFDKKRILSSKVEKVLFDFTHLEPTLELVEVYDNNPENKNLYIKLFNWFHQAYNEDTEVKNKLPSEVKKDLESDLSYFKWITEDFYIDYYQLVLTSNPHFQSYFEIFDQLEKLNLIVVSTGLLRGSECIELLIKKDFIDISKCTEALKSYKYRVVDFKKFLEICPKDPIHQPKYNNYNSIAVYNDTGICQYLDFYQNVLNTVKDCIV